MDFSNGTYQIALWLGHKHAQQVHMAVKVNGELKLPKVQLSNKMEKYELEVRVNEGED